jgi:malate dehydrogenase
MARNQIGVIGYGNIGNKIVDLLLSEKIQPVIVVRNPDKAKALGDDYYSAQLDSDIRPIFTTNYEALKEADSVIVTASVAIEVIAATRNRNCFIDYNTPILCEIAWKLAKVISKNTLIVTMTNPVEGMVYTLKNAGGFESRNVVGVGTAVEAARYETLISEALGMAKAQVVSTVIGGHNENDSVFLPKCTKIGQLPLSHFDLSEQDLLELEKQAKTLGWDIFQKSNQVASITPAVLAVNLAKAHLSNDAKRVVNCTMEVPLAFVNEMLGDRAIESNEPTVTLGVLALLNRNGAEPQQIPISRIDTHSLSKAVQNIIKQQEIVRKFSQPMTEKHDLFVRL